MGGDESDQMITFDYFNGLGFFRNDYFLLWRLSCVSPLVLLNGEMIIFIPKEMITQEMINLVNDSCCNYYLENVYR